MSIFGTISCSPISCATRKLCLGLLRQLLPDLPHRRIEYVELEAEKQQLERHWAPGWKSQKALFGAAGKRSVRLDAYLE